MTNERIRLLVVEDDESRVEVFRSWTKRFPLPVAITWTRSAGAAIGVLRRDRGRVFDGLLIDHDLNTQCLTEVDAYLTGKDVVDAVVEFVDKGVPVLVHSGNTMEGPKLVARLLGAGFSVEYAPFTTMRYLQLQQWLRYVVEASDAVTKYERWKLERRQSGRQANRNQN